MIHATCSSITVNTNRLRLTSSLRVQLDRAMRMYCGQLNATFIQCVGYAAHLNRCELFVARMFYAQHDYLLANAFAMYWHS
jgi:hypothetical protein